MMPGVATDSVRRALAGLDPAGVWIHFGELSSIPRPSGREGEVADYIRRWAADRGFATASDAAGNLRVRVERRGARDGAPHVILQGHLDMVWVTAAGGDNPHAGPVSLIRGPDPDWIHADGTSLGADNGVGVAMILAAAGDPAIVHGPLDLLFTVEEETGLIGASRLDPSILDGDLLINLDSEEDDVFTIGCAGGRAVDVQWTGTPTDAPADDAAILVAVGGLRGGHSGIEINAGRLNAIAILVEALAKAGEAIALRVATIDGGDRGNAIPRHAQALVVVAAADAVRLQGIVEEAIGKRALGHAATESTPEVSFRPTAPPARAFSTAETTVLLGLLGGLPNGVLAMSSKLPELVESSCNLGVLRTREDTVDIACNARSSDPVSLDRVVQRIVAAARAARARATAAAGYPSWDPDPDSRLLKRAVAVYSRLYGQPPKVSAVHAGLECGVIKSKLPRLDALSFGPDIRGAHSTHERVYVPSVAKCYALLTAILADVGS
jgi:dipeptidase D